jgi:hypothetical protein
VSYSVTQPWILESWWYRIQSWFAFLTLEFRILHGCCLPHTCCLQLERSGRASTVVVRQCVNQANKSDTCFISPLMQMKVLVLCLLQFKAEQNDESKYLPNSVFNSQISLGLLKASMCHQSSPVQASCWLCSGLSTWGYGSGFGHLVVDGWWCTVHARDKRCLILLWGMQDDCQNQIFRLSEQTFEEHA